MSFSIWIDWMEEFKEHHDKWTNHGRRVLEDNCKHFDKSKDDNNLRYSGYCDKCDISEDSANPMMNYIYPLELKDFEDKKILEVIKNTNCTIMENEESGEWFLTLCGGGMDLSQDIALAYVILERWIPEDLITQVCKQKGFSISKSNFKRLRKAIIEQSEHYADRFKQLKEEWENIK